MAVMSRACTRKEESEEPSKIQGDGISESEYWYLKAALDFVSGLDIVGDEAAAPASELYQFIYAKLLQVNR